MVGGLIFERAISVLTFFFISWSFGFTILDLCKSSKEKNQFYQFFSELAIGFAAFSLLGVILNVLQVPLHITVYLLLAAAYPVYALVQSFRKKRREKTASIWKQESTYLAIAIIIIAALLFLLYHQGAFGYPWLEDDDPWNHIQSMNYIAQEYTYDVDPEAAEPNPGWANYIEPYPPTFGIIMGVMRQTNTSNVWTLKFFNALMIAVGLLFYFLFFKEYLQSDRKAVFGTLTLAALPSFMSHFIWSQTLALVLFPIGLYAFLRALDDNRWIIPAAITIGSALVSQPVVSFFFGIVVLLIVILLAIQESYGRKKELRKQYAKTIQGAITGAAGVGIGMIYWFEQLFKWGISGILGQKGGEVSGGWASGYALQKYTLAQVVFPPHSSRIDQAIGWGLIITLLLVVAILLIAILWKKTLDVRKDWRFWHMLIWFALLAYLVFAQSFGLQGWGSSRLWAYMAIPLVLLATQGAFILAKSVTKDERIAIGIIAALAIGIVFTSLPAKIDVQTAQWPPGVSWTAPQAELAGYVAMRDRLPANSKVFPMCGGDSRAIGFDMQSEPWNVDVGRFRQQIPNITGEELLAFLEEHSYQYITMDATCVARYGENATMRLANSLSETQRFVPIIQEQGFLLAAVR